MSKYYFCKVLLFICLSASSQKERFSYSKGNYYFTKSSNYAHFAEYSSVKRS